MYADRNSNVAAAFLDRLRQHADKPSGLSSGDTTDTLKPGCFDALSQSLSKRLQIERSNEPSLLSQQTNRALSPIYLVLRGNQHCITTGTTNENNVKPLQEITMFDSKCLGALATQANNINSISIQKGVSIGPTGSGDWSGLSNLYELSYTNTGGLPMTHQFPNIKKLELSRAVPVVGGQDLYNFPDWIASLPSSVTIIIFVYEESLNTFLNKVKGNRRKDDQKGPRVFLRTTSPNGKTGDTSLFPPSNVPLAVAPLALPP